MNSVGLTVTRKMHERTVSLKVNGRERSSITTPTNHFKLTFHCADREFVTLLDAAFHEYIYREYSSEYSWDSSSDTMVFIAGDWELCVCELMQCFTRYTGFTLVKLGSNVHKYEHHSPEELQELLSETRLVP